MQRTTRLAVACGVAAMTVGRMALACPSCPTSDRVRWIVLGDGFAQNLLFALLPFAAIVAAVAVPAGVVRRRETGSSARPMVAAGLALGVGLGGFVDGIVLHQILQWHNMLSSVRPPTNLVDVKVNMVWDGLFHALTWIVTVLGLGLLFRAGKRRETAWSGEVLLGAIAGGWGLFNLVEGIIDHQILGIHHVHPGDGQLAWDLAFLASGPLLGGLGAILVRRGSARC